MDPVKRFEEVLQFRGATEDTVKRFLQVADDFVKCNKKGGFTKHDVIRFLAEKRKEGCEGSYLRYLFFVLEGFFEAVEVPFPFKKDGKLDKRDIPKKSEPHRPYFTLAEQIRLLKAAAKMRPRDNAIIRVAVITGPRRKELHLANKKDYDREGARLYIRTVKRGKPRWRKLDPETVRVLNAYLDKRGNDRAKALFKSTKRTPDRRLSLEELSRIQRRCRKLAGIHKRRAGFHGCRRGLVTLLHNRGVSEKELQEYGGWKTPFMVHEYIQLAPGEVEKKVIKVHPLFNEGGK